MKVPQVRPVVWAVLFLAVAWGLAFAISCRLPRDSFVTGAEETDSMAVKALDASRALMGGQLYEAADRTFHMGVGAYRPPAFTSWFMRLGQAIAPAGHVHLQAAGVNELVPWLYLATRADPHNVEAYVVAAFWLAGDGGRPELAGRVLDEARANNPKDYRIYLEKGRLELKKGAAAEAARMFDAAIRLWELDAGTDKTQAKLDRAEIQLYRGLLCENGGDVSRALTCYRDVLELFPKRAGLRERVAELSGTGHARVAPAAMWQTIMFQRRHVCEREQAEEHASHAEH